MGGDSEAKQQRGQSWGQLNQTFGTSSAAAGDLGATGKAEKAKGLNQLDDVSGYLDTLLHGNRQETAQAVAPAANAATAEADAAKRSQAMLGTGRTGGAVAGNQQIDDDVRKQIATLTAGVKPFAAGALTDIGKFETGVGLQDVSNMLASLGIGGQTAGMAGGQATTAKSAKDAANAALWASIISAGKNASGAMGGG